MHVFEPQIIEISMGPGARLYRGLSKSETGTFERTGRVELVPKHPAGLDVAQYLRTVARDAIDHVVGLRERFLSLSLCLETAVWYATSGGMKDGIVAAMDAPQHVTALKMGSHLPAVWVGDPGPGFIDPRHVTSLVDFRAWIETRSRSQTDHEILLANGRIFPAEVVRVSASRCRADVTPWGMTHFADPSFRTR